MLASGITSSLKRGLDMVFFLLEGELSKFKISVIARQKQGARNLLPCYL